MTRYLFPRFQESREEYVRASDYWLALWEAVDPLARAIYGWHQPWMLPGPIELQDGNPIFTAVSPDVRKGIRVIQGSPRDLHRGVDFAFWLDLFGEDRADPDSITELVIVCVLAPHTSLNALKLMAQWVMTGSTQSLPFIVNERVTAIDEVMLSAAGSY